MMNIPYRLYCLGFFFISSNVVLAQELSLCKKVFNSVVFKVQSIQKNREKHEKQIRLQSIQDADRLVLIKKFNYQVDHLTQETRKLEDLILFWMSDQNGFSGEKKIGYQSKFLELINQNNLNASKTLDMLKEFKNQIDKVNFFEINRKLTLIDKNRLTAHVNQVLRKYIRVLDDRENLVRLTNIQIEDLIENAKK